MNGADLAVKALEANGVKVVFGYPGAANAPFIDSVSIKGALAAPG